VQTQSPQSAPRSKSKAKAANATRKQAAAAVAQGRPVTVWDNPEQDPNLRAHAGESPDGKANKGFAAGKEALKSK
jgi:hypothetical protein